MNGMLGTRFLLFVGGLGGLLYGIDFGVIAVSMPYIKALKIYTDAEVSWIVGAVMFGGILASATAGVLCDRLGRKRMISGSAALFLLAVPVVCFSGESLSVMLAGRVLQGMSAGYMAVVMPMYLAESLPPEIRGRGTGIFQLFLGIGLVSAALAGIVISAVYGAADAAADVVSDQSKSIAWRVNFWWSMAPVSLLFVSSLFIRESPVWLKMKGVAKRDAAASAATVEGGTLLRRKYVIPFVLAVLVLTFNKTIGMGSIIAYAVTLFQKAGLSGTLGNVGDLALKVVNLVMTMVAVMLVDRKGRTWLLKVGTAGLTAGLFAIGTLFLAIEKGWLAPTILSGFVTLAAFLAMQTFYSLGPGICVWLVLSELMPARIRANGMAIALFVNQFVAWGLASTFFPMVNAWGYGPVFFGSAITGILYFLTVLYIPETKGRSLEEIESLFGSASRKNA
jgi:MFS family permease